MKPERIQDRLLEKPEWSALPATLERRWPCDDFLAAARLARVAESVLVDHSVGKEVTIGEAEVKVRLFSAGPVATEALLLARDQVEVAVSVGGGPRC